MSNFSELYKTETANLQDLLKRVFSLDFMFLNKDFNTEEKIGDNFEVNKVEFEDLEGNPLVLQHLANLNESLKNKENKLSTISNKSVFNIKAICPWSIDRYQRLFIDKFIRDKEFKGLFKNSVCLIDGKFQMKGFAKSEKLNHLKVLRIDRNTKIILKTSNKMKISELINNSRFKGTHHSVDATYLFGKGEFSVRWENCFNLFDWPDLSADCHLKIHIDPFCKDSSLYPILQEIQQLKVINSAVDDDKFSWSLVSDENPKLTVDQFIIQLNNILKIGIDKDYNGTNNKSIWKENVYQRKKDITETLWILFQKIDNKVDFKTCVNSMMPILKSNSGNVEFNVNNTTEFSRMLKDRFLNSEVQVTSFMTNLELIVQVGLFKLTKDLLFIISNELSGLSQDESAEIFNKVCRVAHLNTGIDSLFKLFTCVSYMEILKNVLHSDEYKIEALSAVKTFIKCLNFDSVFELEQSLTIKMRGIDLKSKPVTSIWIINFITTMPIYSHKAIVFEVETNNSEFQVFRHDMELSDMQMFG